MSFRVLFITLLLSVPLAGCSSFDDFRKEVFKGASQQQIEPPIRSKHIKKPSPSKVKQSPAPSNQCSYIVRDLSIPNATAVWCMPRVSRR